MKNKISIQCKAAFLLLVFGLNTVVGLACSLGIDMQFNTRHHEPSGTVPVVHVHADGKKHIHHEEKPGHSNKISHHHNKASSHTGKQDTENCCNEKVVKLDQLDKSLAKTLGYNNLLFFTTLVSVFHYTDPLYYFQFTSKVRYFVRGHHPPIPDICVAIQSFRI